MSLACSTSSLFGTSLQSQSVRSQSRRGSRQITEAAGPKGRFFDRPAGDKKESERFSKSETKKKKGLFVPLDKKLTEAWPGKSQKMLKARNRGAGGDGRKVKTSNKVPGATSLPEDTAPFVAGGLALILVVVALLATGGLGVGSIQLPGTT
ncbi:hypothetical protein ABBQ32_005658 [Trebouxia sp. C0010 RCD-2024]